MSEAPKLKQSEEKRYSFTKEILTVMNDVRRAVMGTLALGPSAVVSATKLGIDTAALPFGLTYKMLKRIGCYVDDIRQKMLSILGLSPPQNAASFAH